MTSLQKQLAAIAATTTHQLDLKAQKLAHGKSLLFEPRVAASQSFESIYLISYDGFRELCALDQRFVSFSTNLFSEQSKAEDRTQMSQKENDDLNSVVEAFLTLVGPRLLLKPAVKAVEWLIRRFRIHEYNTEMVILAFLQYHNMPIFQALLSILPADLPPTYRFLAPYVASLANPPRRTIVYTAANTPAFFSAFQGYALKVLKAGHHASSFLSFWAGVTTQAIDAILEYAQSGRKAVQDQRTEELLLRILPVLNECMKISNIPEALVGCYMIIIVLVTKSAFENKILDSLMEAVAYSQETDNLDSCLMCLAIIAEERSDVILPARVTHRLLRIPNLANGIGSLVGRCRVERLTLGCALGALEDVSTSVQNKKAFFSKVLEPKILYDTQISIISSAATRLSKQTGSPETQKEFLDFVISRCQTSAQIENGLTDSAQNGDEDTVMEDVDQIEYHTEPEPVPSLPTIEESSFLDPLPSRSFEEAALAFVQRASSNYNLDALLDLPQLRRKEAEKSALFLSFLVRVWCGPYPVPARQAALRSATALLKKSGKDIDFQLVIPYLLHGLSDASLPVRRSAAECIVVLAEASTGTGKPEKVWGSSDLYGKDSSKVTPLKAELLLKLLSILVTIMEECTMDPKYVSISISGLLSGTSVSKQASSNGSSSIKPAQRSSISAFLAAVAAVTPIVRVRLQLFSVFDFLAKHVTSVRIGTLLPAVRDWCLLSRQDVSSKCEKEKLDVAEAERGNLAILLPREPESIALLKDIICGNVNQDRQTLREAAFERLNAVWPSMKSELRLELATSLLDLALEDSDITSEVEKTSRIRARETLRAVRLSTAVLVTFLQSIPYGLRMPDVPPATKRRRTSHSEMARIDVQTPEETSRVLRRVTLVLELVEGSNPGEHPQLFKGLFSVLNELHVFKQQSGSSLVYLQSMILSSLLPIINTLKETQDAAEYRASIRADLLIDCIRNSSSPQVQNAALLMIASLASWEPELVLHNLMPIFTFMGTTLLRQKDDYSAHVVDQTISRVVPQLAASLRAKNRNFLAGVADLLFSFTAAFEHIPPHRRLKLFLQLATTLGPQDSLSAIIAILVDKYPESASQKKFVVELLIQFEPVVVLKALHGYLELVRDAVRPKRTVSDILFGLNEKQAGHIDTTIENLLSAFAELTKDSLLRKHVGKAFKITADSAEPRTIFASIVETTVQISQQVTTKPTLYEICGKALSSGLSLLPTVDLVKSAELLSTASNHPQVRAAAIKAIEMRTQKVPHNDNAATSAVLTFLPKIEELIQESQEIDLKLVALSCVDQIVERFGKKDTSAVMSMARVVSGPQSFANEDDRLRIMSLVCLASVVDVVDEEFISLLPTVLPVMFGYLEESITSGAKADLYKAIYGLLVTIVERIGFMFTVDHMEEALRLSLRSSASDFGDECAYSRQLFYQKMAEHLEAKSIFTAIKRTWPDAIKESIHAAQEELDLLLLTIETQTKPKLVKTSSVIFSLLLEVFDLRSQCSGQSKVSMDDVDHLEDTMIEAVISMTLKLNDATFRPFFVQLVDWLSASKKDRLSRATTFYRFLSAFFDKFKSIVTNYANHILEHASQTMQELSKSAENAELRESLLSALHKSFLHDQDGFWQSPTHYTTILAPLLSQLTPAYPSLDTLTSSVIPAITELAASASSLDNHREMNSILLKYMRSEHAHIRLASVKTEQSLTSRLGEEWLGLLAEMLPFISELREDDDELVERETQRWINSMEGILGEDLEGMLS
ncbi:hypothetical protein GQ43DRAFT_479562 [Delitschia confertaspora ATCC 74209]|uniref:U3 small nucleolar RNA-associated protein 10 n=1 Tax=Delitschia confertaspora ATCC 74209 TaxID=1513339 RepID=A0A9P4MX59_9PLEO|nr:hypothetical protein GQ43DRAFT_479562 [Delitschia confertaspora ATCC 74209]